MTKPLPPKDKHLTLWKILSQPEGTAFEYWFDDEEYGLHNPLTIQSDGYALDSKGKKVHWNHNLIYALAPKKYEISVSYIKTYYEVSCVEANSIEEAREFGFEEFSNRKDVSIESIEEID